MHPVHVPRKIPVVLSPDEVARLIGSAGNLKNQTALSVAYGAGLRVSEVATLKVSPRGLSGASCCILIGLRLRAGSDLNSSGIWCIAVKCARSMMVMRCTIFRPFVR